MAAPHASRLLFLQLDIQSGLVDRQLKHVVDLILSMGYIVELEFDQPIKA